MQLSSKSQMGMTVDDKLSRVPALIKVRYVSFQGLCCAEGAYTTSHADQKKERSQAAQRLRQIRTRCG